MFGSCWRSLRTLEEQGLTFKETRRVATTGRIRAILRSLAQDSPVAGGRFPRHRGRRRRCRRTQVKDEPKRTPATISQWWFFGPSRTGELKLGNGLNEQLADGLGHPGSSGQPRLGLRRGRPYDHQAIPVANGSAGGMTGDVAGGPSMRVLERRKCQGVKDYIRGLAQ